MDKLHRLLRRGIAVRYINNREAAYVEGMLASDLGNLLGRSNQYRRDDASFGRFGRAAERGFVARVDDHGRCRRNLLRARD